MPIVFLTGGAGSGGAVNGLWWERRPIGLLVNAFNATGRSFRAY